MSTNETTPTGIIVDDDADIRAMFARFMERAGVHVIGEADDGDAALESIRQLKPRVALIDVLIPGPNGLEVAARVQEEALPTRIILCTGFDRKDYVLRAMESGAALLSKKDRFDQLISAALDAALNGDVMMSPRPLRLLLEEYFRLAARERSGGLLTPREVRVAKLVSLGKSNKEIAGELNLSLRTIENVRYGLMKKIGAHGVADVIRYVDLHLNDAGAKLRKTAS